MTPAATAAGRAAAKRPAPGDLASRSPSHNAPPAPAPAPPHATRPHAPRQTRSGTEAGSKLTPRIPRRISGPAGGISGGARSPRTADRSPRTADRTPRTTGRTERIAVRARASGSGAFKRAAALRVPGAATGEGAAIRLANLGVGVPLGLPRHRATRPPLPTGGLRRRRVRRRRLRRMLGAVHLPGMLVGALELVRTAPDQRWLDRLVRSRWWIPVLGVMLTAVVALQVEVLKYGAGTGRAINLATRLESRNQLLSADVASLDSPQRIEQAAAQMGMLMAGPTSVQFVHASAPGAVSEAVSHIRSPDSQSFLTTLASADGSSTIAVPSGSTTTVTDLAAAAVAAVSAGAPVTTGAVPPPTAVDGSPASQAASAASSGAAGD